MLVNGAWLVEHLHDKDLVILAVAVGEIVIAGSVKLIRSGFGQDLHPTVTKLVVFRRKRILVDPDLTDRIFGGQLAAAEAIYVDFASARSCGWTRKSLQIGRKVLRIVRQRLQILSA